MFLLSKAVFSVLRVLLVKVVYDFTFPECSTVLYVIKKLT